MLQFSTLELAPGTKEQLVYRKQRTTPGQLAVLIIKPSNNILNANSTDQNVESIIARFEEKEWSLQALKLLEGNESNIERLIAHYPQPFFDGRIEDVASQLTPAEKEKLIEVWGKEATAYPIYHPLQIAGKGIADYATLAEIWHMGRGNDNKLIDIGHVEGINTISPEKDSNYGKRRLLLVKNNPALPNVQPFFMVNGFSAELAVKFSRSGEKIIIMAFGKEGSYTLEHMRRYAVGATSPYEAEPGSIRYDALHNDTYAGDHPITSADVVGIENNIVHLSENDTDSRHELQLWLPEIL